MNASQLCPLFLRLQGLALHAVAHQIWQVALHLHGAHCDTKFLPQKLVRLVQNVIPTSITCNNYFKRRQYYQLPSEPWQQTD
jgi:hypothetical protein